MKIKDKLIKTQIGVLNFFKKLLDKYNNWWNNNFKENSETIPFLFNIITSLVIGVSFIHSGLPQIISFFIAFLVSFLLLTLARIIILVLLKPLLKNKPQIVYTIIQLFITFTAIWMISSISAGTQVLIPILILAGLVTWIELMFVRSFHGLVIKKIHSITLVVTLVVTIICNIAVGVFLFCDGFEDTYIEEYLLLDDMKKDITLHNEKDISIINSGSLEVASIEYGILEQELHSVTTNLSRYVDYTGMTKLVRDLYWGYSVDAVPLEGKIWYPKEGGNYPTLFIIHGNHILTTQSYQGYSYLGEYLASYGYVVVSVDENFCNGYIDTGLTNENDARAILLLENMKQVQKFNNQEENVLQGKMDFNNITLAGHSRGGEAVGIAALFNSLDNYPDNGNIKLNYDFDIQSIIGISPSCDQYKPSGRDVMLTDINYLLLHGSNDQDVAYMMGEKQYENITYTGENDYFKSYLYIAGANHGQFNTQWGRADLSAPFNLTLNTKNLMEEEQQKNILKIAVKTFLEATIHKDNDAKEFFKNYKTSDTYLPETVYIQGYTDSSFYNLCDYEEDTDLLTGSVSGITIASSGAWYWLESQVRFELDDSSRDNYALEYGWKDSINAYYEVNLNHVYDAKDKEFQFDIMDIREEPITKDEWELLDFTIVITDSKGEKAKLQLADYYTVYPPLPVKTSKIQFLINKSVYKHYFQTIRLSLKDFESNNPELNTASIVNIRFLFDQIDNGRIRLDHVGFIE